MSKRLGIVSIVVISVFAASPASAVAAKGDGNPRKSAAAASKQSRPVPLSLTQPLPASRAGTRRGAQAIPPVTCTAPGLAPPNFYMNCDSFAAGQRSVNETTIRGNPARVNDPSAVMFASSANDYNRTTPPAGDSGFGYYTSLNGSTWTDHGTVPNFSGLTQGDPTLSFHRSGTLYLAGITFNRSNFCDPASGLVLLRNKTPGADPDVWADRVVIPNSDTRFHDKNAITLSRDNVFESWTQFNQSATGNCTGSYISSPIRVARVPHDNANPIAAPTFLPATPGSTFSQGSAIDRDGQGGFWIAWDEFTGAGEEIRIAHWNNTSNTWDLPGPGYEVVGPAGTFSPMRGFRFRANAFPQIAVLSDGPHVVFTKIVNHTGPGGTRQFSRAFHWDRATGTTTEIDPAVDANVTNVLFDVDDQFFAWIVPAGKATPTGPANEYVITYGETDERGARLDDSINWYAYRSDTDTVQRLTNEDMKPNREAQFGGTFIGDYNAASVFSQDPSGLPTNSSLTRFAATFPGIRVFNNYKGNAEVAPFTPTPPVQPDAVRPRGRL